MSAHSESSLRPTNQPAWCLAGVVLASRGVVVLFMCEPQKQALLAKPWLPMLTMYGMRVLTGSISAKYCSQIMEVPRA